MEILRFIDRTDEQNFVNFGVLARVASAEALSGSDIPAGQGITEIALAATPKQENADLGTGLYSLMDLSDALVVCAGQDAAGGALFNFMDGSIQALLTAADGVGMSKNRINTAEAARAAVAHALMAGYTIAQDGPLSHDDIVSGLQNTLYIAHDYIRENLPGGATTAAIAAICAENTLLGKQINLFATGAGDANVIIFYRDKLGMPQALKIIEPADAACKQLIRNNKNYLTLTPEQRRDLREKYIQSIAQKKIISAYKASKWISSLGITAYLGMENLTHDQIFTIRFNMSKFLESHRASKACILVCSDNVGEKIPEADLLVMYKSSSSSIQLTQKLHNYMAEKDWDDGSVAACDVNL